MGQSQSVKRSLEAVLTSEGDEILVVPDHEDADWDFVHRLDAVRRLYGWSHWKLSKKAGLKVDAIHRMFAAGPRSGEEPMRVHFSTVLAVLEALDLGIEFVFRNLPETAAEEAA